MSDTPQEFRYGNRPDGTRNTIHATEHLDIEVRKGKVVAVWFRCMELPFKQHDVDKQREKDMSDVMKIVLKNVMLKAVIVLQKPDQRPVSHCEEKGC